MTTQRNAGAYKSAALTLRTLGRAGLYDPGGTVQLLGPGKPLALLTYLALTPGRRASREFLMELLWSDLDADHARSALRQLLFHLRRLLGEDAIPGAEELTLAIWIEADRDRFLALVEQGELERAMDSYTGAFLPAFGVPGGVAFEQWVDLERAHLQGTLLRTAELLVRRFLNQSRFREAQRLARRVRDEVQWSETAWRLVLEAAVIANDFVSSAVEAEAFAQWALSEGITPEPRTREALARARRVPAATGATTDRRLVAELTGREKEFSAITDGWEMVRSGASRHLHLTAPAGLGKTRLIRDAVARLTTIGVAVAEVRGAPGDRDIAYAFAADLALAIGMLPGAGGVAPASAAALVRLNPALSSRMRGTSGETVDQDALRRRILALTDLVQAVAEEQPFAMVIDDLHWVDDDSYRILEGVLCRVADSHLLCLTAARPGRAAPGESAETLPLMPLTLPQVASLVTALGAIPEGPRWSREFVGGLHEASTGSPLLILQTLRLAMDEGILTLTEGEWRCGDHARLTALLRAGEALRARIRGLPRDQAWVLALLGMAETALPDHALEVGAEGDVPDVTSTLVALERLGLVLRGRSGWLTAHDEIAAASRDTLEPLDCARAERVVGQILAEAAGDDAHSVLRAVRHFRAAGEVAKVNEMFRRYVLLSRRTRDHRPVAELAQVVLQGGDDGEDVRDLVREVPWSWRLGLWSATRRSAAAAVLILILGAAVSGLRARDIRDATLQRLVYADSLGFARVVSVRATAWDGRNTSVTPARGASVNLEAALTFRELPPALSPDGRAVAWNQESGDSTTLDIWLRTPGGIRRLTQQVRDDLVNDWLPDGSGLVGMSNRWSAPAEGGYDIAVFDTTSGIARQVTRGPDHDRLPFVSPDGTRIAFLRESSDQPIRLCITTFDAREPPECRLPAGHALYQLLGWSGPEELVITLDSVDARPLFRYDWVRDTRFALLGPYVSSAQLSRDRKWVVGSVRIAGIRGSQDWVIPLDRPSNARLVDGLGLGASGTRWWEGPPDGGQAVDRIEFEDRTSTLPLGVRTRLNIRAFATTGTEVPLRAPLRWRSSDTMIAVVDSFGEIHPRGVGAVIIEVSLAGWRAASRRFAVRGRPAVTLDEERWDGKWASRWIVFGDPEPLVLEDPDGVAGFWNRGDGTYPSMGVSRRSFSAQEGLGVEVRLSTLLTRDDWQRARTALVAGIDTLALQRGDQRKAPASTGRTDATCGATYPGVSGRLGAGQLGVSGGVTRLVTIGPVAKTLRSGVWWTLRLQILPDGRCGIAVNDRVVWVSPEPIPLTDQFRLRLGDESRETKLLHGPLRIWSGVRTDLDWSRPPGS